MRVSKIRRERSSARAADREPKSAFNAWTKLARRVGQRELRLT
jgi:hypothetical protein